MMKIKIAIVGYGNLGRACEKLIKSRSEFELVGIFTRSSINKLDDLYNTIDVVLVCVGSSADAPVLTPKLAQKFNTVDSFDNHNEIRNYLKSLEEIAQKSKKVAIASVGWDPGLFSVARMLFNAFLPDSSVQTFWGPGVSLGHTNAIKNIEDVTDAIQFTVPQKETLKKVRLGKSVTDKSKHKRICYVVAPQKKQKKITSLIKNMPDYFLGYQTEVNFIERPEFNKKFNGVQNHGGAVIGADKTSKLELRLRTKSNPLFTASIMLAYAAANVRLQKEGRFGVFTAADIAPKYLFSDCIQVL